MVQTSTQRMLLKSYWGEEHIYIEDFPYYGKFEGKCKLLSARDGSNAQKFTKAMLEEGLADKTFTYQDLTEWVASPKALSQK